MKKITEFIENFREKNWDYFFFNWWCYIFARILKRKFWWDIYYNWDHVVLQFNKVLYDINWAVSYQTQLSNYIIIDEMSEKRFEDYQNF